MVELPDLGGTLDQNIPLCRTQYVFVPYGQEADRTASSSESSLVEEDKCEVEDDVQGVKIIKII